MNANKASKLKVGQRIMWDGDECDLGTVIKHNIPETGVFLKWDDPHVNGGWVDYEDMHMMEMEAKE